jgi:hypothetical protein
MYWIKKESRQGAEDSEKAYNAIEAVLGVRRGRMMNPLWNLVTPRVQIADAQDLAIISNLHIGGLVAPTVDQRITISENAIGASAEVPADVDQFEVDHPVANPAEEDQRRSDFEDRFPIWKDKGYIKTLGYIAVVDLLIGNFDRINRNLNLKNWLVEGRSKTISLIDNIETEGSLEDLDAWKANQFVNAFHNLGMQTLIDKFMQANEGNYQARSIIYRLDRFKEGIVLAYSDLERLNREVPPHIYRLGDDAFNTQMRQRVTWLM